MGDVGIRELERRWRETGVEADEVAWLRARVQAGTVEESRARLAGRLGNGAARAVFGDLELFDSAGEVAAALVDDEAQIRASLAALRRGWAAHQSIYEEYLNAAELIRGVIASIEAWIACPCAEHAGQLDLSTRQRVMIGLEHVMQGAGEADSALYEVARGIDSFWAPELCQTSLRAALVGGTFETHVLEPIREDLVPWLLGYRDPVRDRVMERASGQP